MGDCIDRQAVLDGIEELKKSPWATDKRGNGFEYLIKEVLEVVADLCVKQAPPVTPKQKMGRWIKIDDFFMAKCSECGEIVDSRMISKYPYCHCGAKMAESEG